MRGQGSRFRVEGSGSGSEIRVLRSGIRVSGFRSRFSVFRFRVSGSGFRVSGSEFQVSSFEFQVSGSGFLVLGSMFRLSGSGSRVLGLGGHRGNVLQLPLGRGGPREHLPETEHVNLTWMCAPCQLRNGKCQLQMKLWSM